MATAWPATLPTRFGAAGFQGRTPDNALRTPSMSGRPKTRRTSTKFTHPIRDTMRIDQTQLQAFWTFYRTTLEDGTLPFQGLTHPATGSDTVWQFADEPTFETYGESGTVFTLTLSLYALPDTPT